MAHIDRLHLCEMQVNNVILHDSSFKTFKQECSATIKVHLSDDCQSLVVREMSLQHNHELSAAAYMNLPRQRKLDADVSLYTMSDNICNTVNIAFLV